MQTKVSSDLLNSLRSFLRRTDLYLRYLFIFSITLVKNYNCFVLKNQFLRMKIQIVIMRTCATFPAHFFLSSRYPLEFLCPLSITLIIYFCFFLTDSRYSTIISLLLFQCKRNETSRPILAVGWASERMFVQNRNVRDFIDKRGNNKEYDVANKLNYNDLERGEGA